MYWGQIAVAICLAFLSGYIAIRSGGTAFVAAIAGILTYLLTRWVIAWVYRVRFWYTTNRRDRSRSCPNCNGYIYRQSGDWLLQCKRCGWTEGWPLVRWITRSVPARQFRRTIIGPQLVVGLILVGLLAAGSLAGVTPGDVGERFDAITDSSDGTTPQPGTPGDVGQTATSSNSPTPTSSIRGYDQSTVREAFLSQLNEERSDRGLQQLSLSSELTAMGETHAANMAEHDYIGHEWPDGTTIQDRYRDRGLLPECRLPIRGSNQYYPGAENAAGAYVNRRFHSSGGAYYVTSEAELGQALVDIWMNSPPHQRAMLVYSADEVGLGLNITESGKAYAALELC